LATEGGIPVKIKTGKEISEPAADITFTNPMAVPAEKIKASFQNSMAAKLLV
jgi:hypothetical protein